MPRNPQHVSDVLALVQKLLEKDNPNQAIELIRGFGQESPELLNAYGVALMRAGAPSKAIEVYRRLVLYGDSVCTMPNVPTLFKTNFATALLLTGNVTGCLTMLREAGDEQDMGVKQLRAAIATWMRSLSWWQRLLFKVFERLPGIPVTLGFAPGGLFSPRTLRPAM